MEELGHLIKLRHEKLADLREKGIAPYINRFKVDTAIKSLVQDFDGGSKEELDEKNVTLNKLYSIRCFTSRTCNNQITNLHCIAIFITI